MIANVGAAPSSFSVSAGAPWLRVTPSSGTITARATLTGIVNVFDCTAEARATNRQALNRELNAGFAAKKSAEWVEILNKGGVPCGPIHRVDQVFADPQVVHRGLRLDLAHPTAGSAPQVASPSGVNQSTRT